MTESEQKPETEAGQEAEELAKKLWDDILVICTGPGTFTNEQVDGYVRNRIALAFAEVIHQRNAAFLHIGEVWMERNRAVQDMLEIEKQIREQNDFLFEAGKKHGEMVIAGEKAKAWARRWKLVAKAFRGDLRTVILEDD